MTYQSVGSGARLCRSRSVGRRRRNPRDVVDQRCHLPDLRSHHPALAARSGPAVVRKATLRARTMRPVRLSVPSRLPGPGCRPVGVMLDVLQNRTTRTIARSHRARRTAGRARESRRALRRPVRGASATQTGLLLATIPLGAAVGVALLVRVVPAAIRHRVALGMAILAGVPLIASGVLGHLGPAAACWFVAGVGGAYMVEVLVTLVSSVPDGRRARVISVVSAFVARLAGPRAPHLRADCLSDVPGHRRRSGRRSRLGTRGADRRDWIRSARESARRAGGFASQKWMTRSGPRRQSTG